MYIILDYICVQISCNNLPVSIVNCLNFLFSLYGYNHFVASMNVMIVVLKSIRANFNYHLSQPSYNILHYVVCR